MLYHPSPPTDIFGLFFTWHYDQNLRSQMAKIDILLMTKTGKKPLRSNSLRSNERKSFHPLNYLIRLPWCDHVHRRKGFGAFGWHIHKRFDVWSTEKVKAERIALQHILRFDRTAYSLWIGLAFWINCSILFTNETQSPITFKLNGTIWYP